ncbi:hypothetical protein H6F67_01845 [Microcoleus sp. FACHB-1515]|nr:hypothetical protein [Microcoleus sp. FACHB-1515]MBD2088604.1 hypothetical protein [Microcoleus sp. FACHB-1515]
MIGQSMRQQIQAQQAIQSRCSWAIEPVPVCAKGTSAPLPDVWSKRRL